MMKDSIRSKLDSLCERHEELAALMSDAGIINNQTKFRQFSQEYADIEDVVKCYEKFKHASNALKEAEVMLTENDAEMRAMAQDEIKHNKKLLNELETELQALMLPQDPRDKCNVFLEIRAGTGGDEAAIFSGDLFKMYSRYADQKGWRVEVLNEHYGEHGGYKEIICRIEGNNVYSHLKFESGAHRVRSEEHTSESSHVSFDSRSRMPSSA